MPQSNTILTTDNKDRTSATAGSSTGSFLIPKMLFSELLMAVRKNLIFRALAAKVIGPKSIPGSSLDFSEQEPESTNVFRTGTGAEIGLNAENYSGFNMKPIKYGVRIKIPRELEEDSQWDVMSLNVQTAGYELADNEESLIVATLDTGSGQTRGTRIANSNATLPPTDITSGMKGLWEENYTPSDFIVGTEVAEDIMNTDTFQEAHKSGVNDPSKGLITSIFNMKVWVSNNVTATYGYILDRRFAFIGVEKRPVTIERYFDAARDSSFAVATQRIVWRYWRPGAIARIITT